MSARAWARTAWTVAAVAIGTLAATSATAGLGAEDPLPRSDDGLAAVIARYQARIPELMAEQHIPGLAIAVVDDDRTLWQQGFGTTDDDGGSPVTVDTIFSVESMSKVFTATAVMQAVQAGLVDLDAPITTYLPDFTVRSAFESHPEQRITLRMMLSCTAGFTHESPVGNSFEPDPGDFDEHIRSISDTWLRFPVGTGFAYSNLGFELAAAILEQVEDKPFPDVMRDTLLAPIGMEHSTFDRAAVNATEDRAVGRSDSIVVQPVDIPVMAAGGLWTSAADLAGFLRFQLGNGTLGGRTMLDAKLMDEMRTVPASAASTRAGYALGVARTAWVDGGYAELLNHAGGGYGFISDLWWAPQLRLGVAVLTNSTESDVQGGLAIDILSDLVLQPGSPYHDRLLALPSQSSVVPEGGDFVAPPDLAARISNAALPSSSDQDRRWDGYGGFYRSGEPGSMNPTNPASKFYVRSGVPYFDAGEDGTLVHHRLTEVRPGVFLAENGETLDLRGPSLYWRGLDLNPVTGGPLTVQWALLAAVSGIAIWWLVGAVVGTLRRRRSREGSPVDGRASRRLFAALAAVGAVTALAAVAALVAVPGLVDVGFLGWLEVPLGVRILFHLPLALTVVAACLLGLLNAGAVRRWWAPRVKIRDAALTVALAVFSIQMGLWNLVGWGF